MALQLCATVEQQLRHQGSGRIRDLENHVVDRLEMGQELGTILRAIEPARTCTSPTSRSSTTQEAVFYNLTTV